MTSPVAYSDILAMLDQYRAQYEGLYNDKTALTNQLAVAEATLAGYEPKVNDIAAWSADPNGPTMLLLMSSPGPGSDRLRFRLVPMSSGAANRTVGKNGVNPLYIGRIDAKAGGTYGGFTVEGTDQGHEYSGIYITGSGMVADISVEGGSSGSGNAPPHECPGVDYNVCKDMVAYNVRSVPGYRTQTGSMIEVNNSDGLTLVGHVAHGSTGGCGIANWHTKDFTDMYGNYDKNKRANNTERPKGIHRYICTNWGMNDSKGRVITFNGDIDSAELYIINPVFTTDNSGRPMGICVYPTYTFIDPVTKVKSQKPNKVTAANIHIIEHDIDVTHDKRFLIGAIG